MAEPGYGEKKVKKSLCLAATLLQQSIQAQKIKFGPEFDSIIAQCREVAESGDTKLVVEKGIKDQVREMLVRAGFTIDNCASDSGVIIWWKFADLSQDCATTSL